MKVINMSKVKDIKYFGINDIESKLFNKALNNERHNHLWKYVIDDMNIICAIKVITRNSGSKTAGVDGITKKEIMKMELDTVIKEVKNRLYGKTKPSGRQVLIPKSDGRFRPLGITNLYDRIAQQCIRNILEPITEAHFFPESFGFRKDRSAKECMAYIATSLQHLDDGHIYDCDLKGYFDTVQIDIVLNKLRENHNIQDKQFLKAIKQLMWIDLKSPNLKYNGIGLRQGTILGPILANVMFHDFELKLNKINGYNRKNGREIVQNPNIFKNFGKNYKRGKDFYFNWLGKKRVVRIIRYADDFLLISKGKYDIYDIIMMLDDWCKENGLEINQDKTQLIRVTPKCDIKIKFLGYRYHKMHDPIRGNTYIISPKNQNELWKETKSRLRWALYKNNIKYFIQYIRGVFQYYDICTNMGWLIQRIHLYLFKFMNRKKGKRRRRYIEYVPSGGKDKLSYFIIGKVKLNLWELRNSSVTSTKTYLLQVNKMWQPDNECYKDLTWIKEFYENRDKLDRNTTNLIYVPSLLKQQKVEPVTGIPLLKIDPKDIQIHHKKPISKGGKDEYRNLILVKIQTHKIIHKPILEPKDIKKYYNLTKLADLRKKCGYTYVLPTLPF